MIGSNLQGGESHHLFEDVELVDVVHVVLDLVHLLRLNLKHVVLLLEDHVLPLLLLRGIRLVEIRLHPRLVRTILSATAGRVERHRRLKLLESRLLLCHG